VYICVDVTMPSKNLLTSQSNNFYDFIFVKNNRANMAVKRVDLLLLTGVIFYICTSMDNNILLHVVLLYFSIYIIIGHKCLFF